MSPWQIASQVRWLIARRRWDDNASNSVIFHDDAVRITPMDTQDAIGQSMTPMALVRPPSHESDPEHPDLLPSIDIDVDVIASVQNDRFGQAGYVGGVVLDETKSGGRGLGEIAREVVEELAKCDRRACGVSLRLKSTGAVQAREVGRVLYCSQTLRFNARGTLANQYQPILTKPGTPFGQVSGGVEAFSVIVPNRYDAVQIVGRFANGSTAPATVTAGSEAFTDDVSSLHGEEFVIFGDNAGGVPVTAVPSPGEYSWSLFVGYNPRGGTSPIEYSPPLSATLTIP